VALHDVGPALVSDVSISGPGEAIHTRQRLRTSDLGFCKIDLPVRAHAFIEQELPYPEPSPATAAGADHLYYTVSVQAVRVARVVGC
jgi:hypothetical protein